MWSVQAAEIVRALLQPLAQLPARLQRIEVLRQCSRRLPMPLRKTAWWTLGRVKWVLRRLGLTSSGDFPGSVRPWGLAVHVDPLSAAAFRTAAVSEVDPSAAAAVVSARPPLAQWPDDVPVIRVSADVPPIPDRLVPYAYDLVRRHGLATFGPRCKPWGGQRWHGQRVRTVRLPTAQEVHEHPDDVRRRLQHAVAIIDNVATYPSPADRVRSLCWAAAVGVPVVVEDASELLGLLPPTVLATMTGVTAVELGDPSRRDALAYQQWAAVLDDMGRLAVWTRLLEDHGLEVPSSMRPAISVVVATRRPELVEWWTTQIASQRLQPHQVVVALHGDGFTQRHEATIRERLGGTVDLVRTDASQIFGEVLSVASDRAAGDLIVKWDDDDLYSTAHLADLVRAHHYSGATLVGKASDFVYLAGSDVTVRRHQAPHEIFSPTVAGGTLCIGRDDLRAVGGWPAHERGVDVGLIRAVGAAGGTTYRTTGFGYLMVRRPAGHGHTWTVGDQHFLAQATDVWPGLAAERALIDQDPAVMATLRRTVSASAPQR